MHSFHLGLLLNIKFSLCKQIPLVHWKDNKERVVSTSLVIMKYESTTKAEISLPTSRNVRFGPVLVQAHHSFIDWSGASGYHGFKHDDACRMRPIHPVAYKLLGVGGAAPRLLTGHQNHRVGLSPSTYRVSISTI